MKYIIYVLFPSPSLLPGRFYLRARERPGAGGRAQKGVRGATSYIYQACSVSRFGAFAPKWRIWTPSLRIFFLVWRVAPKA